jgi:hypothetical protein
MLGSGLADADTPVEKVEGPKENKRNDDAEGKGEVVRKDGLRGEERENDARRGEDAGCVAEMEAGAGSSGEPGGGRGCCGGGGGGVGGCVERRICAETPSWTPSEDGGR